MEQLNEGLAISLRGAEAETMVESCLAQLARWDVVVPAVRPLVLDFGLGEFKKTGLIEFWIANQVKEGYCGKYMFVFDGQTCPAHAHKEKHETFFVMKGAVRMNYLGTVRDMNEGDVLAVDPGNPHSFTGIGPALLLELSKPCMIDDNYFENTQIPIGGNWRG